MGKGSEVKPRQYRQRLSPYIQLYRLLLSVSLDSSATTFPWFHPLLFTFSGFSFNPISYLELICSLGRVVWKRLYEYTLVYPIWFHLTAQQVRASSAVMSSFYQLLVSRRMRNHSLHSQNELGNPIRLDWNDNRMAYPFSPCGVNVRRPSHSGSIRYCAFVR
jgi:hypothetical protein